MTSTELRLMFIEKHKINLLKIEIDKLKNIMDGKKIQCDLECDHLFPDGALAMFEKEKICLFCGHEISDKTIFKALE